MAFDPLPTNLFAGMSEDGTNLTIPLASIPGLSAAEADAVTGDARKIAYHLIKRIAAWYDAIDPVADRPANMRSSAGQPSAIPDGKFIVNYNIGFTTSPAAPLDLEVADEV